MEFSMKLTQENHLKALKEQNFGLLLIALCEHLSAQKIENFIHWDHMFAQDVKVEIDGKFLTPAIDFVEKEIRLTISWLVIKGSRWFYIKISGMKNLNVQNFSQETRLFLKQRMQNIGRRLELRYWMIKNYSALQRKIVDTIIQVLVIYFAFIGIKFGG